MAEKLVPLNVKDVGPSTQKIIDALKATIKGQDRAVDDLSEAFARYQAGLKDADRPIFVALLLGPSGVGKTLVSETLAKHFFGSKTAFTKISGPEYSQPHEVARLIGSPPGYIGYRDPSGPDYDPTSSTPVLSQYNIDRHHYELTKSRKAKELKSLNVLYEKNQTDEAKLKRSRQDIQKIKELMNVLRGWVKSLEKQCQSETDAQKKQALASELDELKKQISEYDQHFSVLEKDLKQFDKEFKLKKEVFEKNFALAKKEGYLYDHDNPANFLSILLFDEIEKAHPDLFNILLEITDKGRIQLGNGKITSFKYSFIFMTGNVARDQIADILTGGKIGFGKNQAAADKKVDKDIYSVAMEEAKKVFPPEFIGRLDKVIVFRPLSSETMIEILDAHINDLRNDLVKAKKPLTIEISQSAKEFLVRKATERAEYGARMIKSRIKKYITDKLVRAFDNGSLKPSDVVVIDLVAVDGKEKLNFSKKEK